MAKSKANGKKNATTKKPAATKPTADVNPRALRRGQKLVYTGGSPRVEVKGGSVGEFMRARRGGRAVQIRWASGKGKSVVLAKVLALG